MAKKIAVGLFGVAVERRKEILLNGQQQLRYHMPINTAQALEAKHASGPPGKGAVIEYTLVQYLH